MMSYRATAIFKTSFLEQPRRGKTREALITPYKRSAVWGLHLLTELTNTKSLNPV